MKGGLAVDAAVMGRERREEGGAEASWVQTSIERTYYTLVVKTRLHVPNISSAAGCGAALRGSSQR